jgi:hypothetical protein
MGPLSVVVLDELPTAGSPCAVGQFVRLAAAERELKLATRISRTVCGFQRAFNEWSVDSRVKNCLRLFAQAQMSTRRLHNSASEFFELRQNRWNMKN